jgi:hypothetical protein
LGKPAIFTLRELAVAAVAASVLVVTALHVRPVETEPRPVVERLMQVAWRDSVAARAPWAIATSTEALGTPQFEADRRAFAEDLLRTGRLTAARADSLATVAVREAYLRRVPPALVFGVLLTENAEFKSTSRSNAGAVGLMQIVPRVWVRTLGRRFGTNLRNDETNLRYGVFILSHLVHGAPDSLTADHSVRRGLLRYNGCVRGTNTPNCHRYPDVVRSRIERYALSQCGSRGYDGCVAQPLRLSMREDVGAQPLQGMPSVLIAQPAPIRSGSGD